MKLLLDNCMSRRLVQRLADAGHDVDWVGWWEGDPGDESILRRAFADGRVLITLDKGFGRLAFERRLPHRGIIWLRNVDAVEYHRLISRAIELHEPELNTAALVVIAPYGMRVRRSAFDDEA